MPNNYMYRGEQYDADLGLYYLRARYYNSLTGRFLSRDPESGKPRDPKTLHKYLYAGGDPVNAVDPTGRDLVEEGTVLSEDIQVIKDVLWVNSTGCIGFGIFEHSGFGNASDPGQAIADIWCYLVGTATIFF
jgi:RHS repeat-associated protein